MRRITHVLLLVSGISLVLVSCGDTSILNPAIAENHAVNIKTIPEGGMLETGESLVFSVFSPAGEESPSRLDITLFAEDGSTAASKSIEYPNAGQDTTLDFPDIETGRYRIEFILYGSNSVLAEKNFTFFFTAGKYTVRGIESFPPVISPNSNVLLKAILDAPEGSNPYLRWKQNKTVLASGMMADGFANIYWFTPKENGVYTLSIEVFPVPPAPGSTYHFSSPSIMKTELYISSNNSPPENDFSPRQSYYSLYHFNGSLKDTGSGQGADGSNDAKEIRRLEPAVQEDILGYRFNGQSGFQVPRLILPVEYGNLNPFTLSLALSFESLEKDAVLIKTQSENFALELHLGEDLAPVAILKTGPNLVEIPSGFNDMRVNKRYILSLSIRPDGNTFHAKWALSNSMGEILGEVQSFNLALSGISSRGTTTVGGSGGFKGILDEIGVFYRYDGQYSVDPDLF